MAPPPVVIDAAEVCNGCAGLLKTVLIMKTAVHNPVAFRGYNSHENNLIPKLTEEFTFAIDSVMKGVHATVARRVKEGEAEPHDDMYPVLQHVRGYVHDKGPQARKTLYVVARLNVTEVTAQELDALAAGTKTKPQGAIPLKWVHGGFVEISYENRSAPRVMRLAGMPGETNASTLLAVLLRAGLKVDKVDPAKWHPDHTFNLKGHFDVTFGAGAEPPESLVLAGAEGHRMDLKFTSPSRTKPVMLDESQLPPPPRSYADAVAKPAVPRPATPQGATAPAPGAKRQRTRKPKQPAAPAGEVTTPPKEAPGVILVGKMVAVCGFCGTQGHAVADCPSRGQKTWADKPDEDMIDSPEAGGTGPVHTGSATNDGEQHPAAAATASSNPDGL